jgi:anti-anti-sigma factor
MGKLRSSQSRPVITTRSENGVVVVSVHGRLTIGSQAELALKPEIEKLLDIGLKRFTLDLQDVKRIDSAGLGVMVEAHMLIVKRPGGECSVTNPPRNVSNVLTITELRGIIKSWRN